MPNNNEPIWLGRPNGHLFMFRKFIFLFFSVEWINKGKCEENRKEN
jgi:hypothetical protein